MDGQLDAIPKANYGRQPEIRIGGNPIPVIAFFGAKGGVGKTTIAKTFAELVTCASARDGRHPNVLAIDFDVDHRGLTTLLGTGVVYNFPTVHEQIAMRSTQGADGVDISDAIDRPAGARGRLYLMPSAPREAANVFHEIASIEPSQLLTLITEMVQRVVDKYVVSCVVIDCGPIVNPYTAAAAKLSTAAFIVGQNEAITYQSIGVQPARIKSFYPDFNSDRVKIIINKFRNIERIKEQAERMDIYFAIPFTIDIVDESEGIRDLDKFRLLLFQRAMVDLVDKVLKGRPDLIPNPATLLDTESRAVLEKAPRMRRSKRITRLAFLRHLRLLGILLIVLGVGGLFASRNRDTQPQARATPTGQPSIRLDSRRLVNASIVAILAGLGSAVVGFWAASRRRRLHGGVLALQKGGAEWWFGQMSSGPSGRALLDELKQVASATPGSNED